MTTINTQVDCGRRTYWLNSLPGAARTAYLLSPSLLANGKQYSSIFGRFSMRWATHVCFLPKFRTTKAAADGISRVRHLARLLGSPDLFWGADDRGTHAGKKGPLLYVNLNRSEEEWQGCRNPGNENVVDRSKTPASRSHRRAFTILRRTYHSRTVRQTRIAASQSLKGWRVSRRFSGA